MAVGKEKILSVHKKFVGQKRLLIEIYLPVVEIGRQALQDCSSLYSESN